MKEGTHFPNQDQEKLIPSEPRLRGMDKILTLLESEQLPDGEMINWKQLHERVKPYHSMLEFTDNVREAVREYVAAKIPKLKEEIPALEDLKDEALLDALTHNWFEAVEETGGQRREVLLTVAAHIVKRIEVLAERKLLREASPEQLNELDVDSPMRDLLIDALEISNKADPLFIRFMAYSRLSGEPPEGATPTGLHLPGSEELHTVAELFPHETQFLAKKLADLAEKDVAWKSQPGADVFARYLQTLGEFYESTDPQAAAKLQKKIKKQYAEVIASGFPVLLTPASEGYLKEPYLDPELKVSIANKETKREEQAFRGARDLMAESLDDIGAGQFKENIKKMEVRSSIVLGGFGANLTMDAVAQEDPAYLLFLSEQIRTYDDRFPSFVALIEGSDAHFPDTAGESRKNYIERMSRMSTMLHEFGHPVYPSESPAGKRLGRKPLTVVDEVKAEMLWRGLVPRMAESGFAGTREQWADAMIAVSLMYLNDQPEEDPYYSAAVYTLNDLFKKGIVALKGGKITVKDVDGYFNIMKESFLEVLSLYQDKEMTERKASQWVKKRCVPSDEVQELIDFVKSLPD